MAQDIPVSLDGAGAPFEVVGEEAGLFMAPTLATAGSFLALNPTATDAWVIRFTQLVSAGGAAPVEPGGRKPVYGMETGGREGRMAKHAGIMVAQTEVFMNRPQLFDEVRPQFSTHFADALSVATSGLSGGTPVNSVHTHSIHDVISGEAAGDRVRVDADRADGFELAVIRALGKQLDRGVNPANCVLVVHPAVRTYLALQRMGDGTVPLYGAADPFQGLDVVYDHNFASPSAAGADAPIGAIVHRGEWIARYRQALTFVEDDRSTLFFDAGDGQGPAWHSLLQENLRALLGEVFANTLSKTDDSATGIWSEAGA